MPTRAPLSSQVYYTDPSRRYVAGGAQVCSVDALIKVLERGEVRRVAERTVRLKRVVPFGAKDAQCELKEGDEEEEEDEERLK